VEQMPEPRRSCPPSNPEVGEPATMGWWTDPDRPAWSVRIEYALDGEWDAPVRHRLVTAVIQDSAVRPVTVSYGRLLLVWLLLHADNRREAATAALTILEGTHDRLRLGLLGDRLAVDVAPAVPGQRA
jgi:hypothetical protein